MYVDKGIAMIPYDSENLDFSLSPGRWHPGFVFRFWNSIFIDIIISFNQIFLAESAPAKSSLSLEGTLARN